jgi:hypothetical protein
MIYHLLWGGWDNPNCVQYPNPNFIFKGSLVDPRLRASNEHILIVRVPRAGGRPGYPAPFQHPARHSTLFSLKEASHAIYYEQATHQQY